MAFEIHMYSRASRPTTAEEHAVDTLHSRLDRFGRHLRRAGVRFGEVISASGGVERTCRIDVMLAGILDAPRLLVEERAATMQQAVERAAKAIEGAVLRQVEAVEHRIARRYKRRGVRAKAERARLLELPERESGVELTGAEGEERAEGAREGRSVTPRAVKTAHPLRGRHIHMTQHQSRATSAFETSEAKRPSRKSTRKSANRSKRDNNQARRNQRAVGSPQARAARAA